MAEIQSIKTIFPVLDVEALKSSGSLKKGIEQFPERPAQADRTKAATAPEMKPQQSAQTERIGTARPQAAGVQQRAQTGTTHAAKTLETKSQKSADSLRSYHPGQIRKKAAPLPELGKNIDIRV